MDLDLQPEDQTVLEMEIVNIEGASKKLCKIDGQCIEPLGFFWGILLTFMAFLISLVGMVAWIFGLVCQPYFLPHPIILCDGFGVL